MKSTINYSIFKTVRGNRKLSSHHLDKLGTDIARNNLLKYVPILVNEKMEVIDGQHRLAVAKKLRKEIFYEIVPSSDLETVQKINSSTKAWAMTDYLESWIERGNEQYVMLKEFMTLNNLPLACSIRLSAWVKGSPAGQFRQGKFVVANNGFADRAVKIIKALATVNTSLIVYSHKFLIALMSVVESDLYDEERMVEQIVNKQPRLWSSENKKDYIHQLEGIYNTKLSKHAVHFT